MYVLRLIRGENVFSTIMHFCEQRRIEHAVFSAIGAVNDVTLGYYDLGAKQYGSRKYETEHEVASMTGNVSLVEGKPFLHIHAVLSGIAPGTENECIGGHVFAATVAVTLEVYLTAFNEPISRTHDDDVGLKLLDCPNA